MAKAENLEPPREGLIRQEIISYEEDEKGMITMQNKIEIIAAIDELNQYLNGNVTKTSLQITLDELINNL